MGWDWMGLVIIGILRAPSGAYKRHRGRHVKGGGEEKETQTSSVILSITSYVCKCPNLSIAEKTWPLRRLNFKIDINFVNVIQSILLSLSLMPIESTLSQCLIR